MRRCAVCGGESGDRSQYCFHCGASLESGSVGSPPVPGPAPGAFQGGAEPSPVPTVPERPHHVVSAPPAPGAVGTEPDGRLGGRQRIETAPTTAAGQPADRQAGRLGEVPAGTLIDGKYSIERVLGEGGMGVVYLARENHTGIEVVLKSIRPEVAHRSDTRARMLSEGQALARIDHPNVVQLKAVVEDGQGLWLVMQYVGGESIEQTIARYAERGAFLSVDEVVGAFRQIVAGVGAAHREGLIHRDLKPANILVRAKDGVVKVTDFGIAKVEADAIAGRGQTQGFLGSPHYTSPEQVLGRADLDRRVDIYALGILLFEMLTNRVPFDADSAFEVMRMQADTVMPRVSASRPEIPRALDDVIRRACAKDRDQRYQSADELLAAVLAALPGYGVPTTLDDMPLLPARQPVATAPAFPAVGAPPGAWGPGASPVATGPGAYGHQAPAGTITGQATALPASASGSSWGWVAVVGGFVVLVGGIGTLAALGLFSASDGASAPDTAAPTGATVEPPATVEPVPDPTFHAADSTSGFEPLVGRWASDNGRAVEAVIVGDALEFRVLDASEFSAQDYRLGEPRFVLRALPTTATEFAVEDRIRPLPPKGLSYDPVEARNTCLSLRSEASGKPLRAVVEGDRMTVDFAKVEPTIGNFVLDGDRITSCRGLQALRSERAPLLLHRVR